METQDTQAFPEDTSEVATGVEPVQTAAPESHRFEPPKGFESKFRKMDLHLSAFDGPLDRKSTRLNSSHSRASRMPSSA